MPKTEPKAVALRRSSRFKPLELAPKIKYYKMLTADMWHRGFQYKEGLNVDHVPFNPSGVCRHGGLYYTSHKHLAEWCSPGWPLIADVTVPVDAQVYAEPCGTKWKADQLVLSNIRPLRQFFAELDEATVCKILARKGYMLEFVDNQTEAMCMAVVRADPLQLEHVKNQTEAVCMEAIRGYPFALRCVRKQTKELCMAAVQLDGFALAAVRRQTKTICAAAIARNWDARVLVKGYDN
jgi:hypothetical protein